MYMCMCVFNGERRIREAQERLDYDPNLMRCTKGLLKFHSIPVLLHNTDFREYTHSAGVWFIHCIVKSNMKMQIFSMIL